LVRWPGLVPARTEINDLFPAEDWATTLVAAAGEPDVKNKLLAGYSFWRQGLRSDPFERSPPLCFFRRKP